MTRKHFEAAASVLYRLVTANERSVRAEVDNGITGCPDGLADDPYIPEGDFYWYTRGYGGPSHLSLVNWLRSLRGSILTSTGSDSWRPAD